jgi:alpha-L-fucosidase
VILYIDWKKTVLKINVYVYSIAEFYNPYEWADIFKAAGAQ